MYKAASSSHVGKSIFEHLFPMFLSEHLKVSTSDQNIENEPKRSDDEKLGCLLNEISQTSIEDVADLISDFIDILIKLDDFNYTNIFNRFKDPAFDIYTREILCEIIKRAIAFSDQYEQLYKFVVQIDLTQDCNFDLKLLQCTIK